MNSSMMPTWIMMGRVSRSHDGESSSVHIWLIDCLLVPTTVSYQEFLAMFREQTNSIVSQVRIQSGDASDKDAIIGTDAIIPGDIVDSKDTP